MRIQQFLFLFLPIIIMVAGCKPVPDTPSLQGVGLLLEETIDDQGWNSKGYQGLLGIHSNLQVDVFFKEDVNTFEKVERAVSDFSQDDVNLVFGHGRIFADFFSELGEKYPDIHFVSFNGDVTGSNVTSLHFESYAMGYFAGMLASKMSKTGHVGVIAAYSWQPEVRGFADGAVYKSDTEVHVDYVNDWSNGERALEFLRDMKNHHQVDVFYPTGDGYHIKVIEQVKTEGLYAIGYIGDQSDLGEKTVLTSTIQHVDELYELIAEQFHKGDLEAGNKSYDFQQGVISLGSFSPDVPEEIRSEMLEVVENYIQTGELPTN
ncbi:BMP family ABC transporter substrate-binding protein [Bacillus solitudinis]|uniref:BMP family ABC transporter substrate-binding protein n=1 Tax=Bacillus solitudinis TaxID=2014074 RepID=UPI000C243C45|nr:BMP family ABC transporter substrate-binding protein [Bacillus solitudinis]